MIFRRPLYAVRKADSWRLTPCGQYRMTSQDEALRLVRFGTIRRSIRRGEDGRTTMAFYLGVAFVLLFLLGGVAMSYVPYLKDGSPRDHSQHGDPLTKH